MEPIYRILRVGENIIIDVEYEYEVNNVKISNKVTFWGNFESVDLALEEFKKFYKEPVLINNSFINNYLY